MRSWGKNISRSFVLLAGILISLYLKNYLDKILALSGCVLGATSAVIVPALCHIKKVATSQRDKIIDMVIIIAGTIILVVTTI
jgi:hypothetical protein